MKKLYFVLTLLSILHLSCNKNEKLIKDLDKFVTKTKLECSKYNASDWTTRDAEFSSLVEDKFYYLRSRMSDEEISRANELIGHYKALKIKKGIKDISNSINDAIDQSKGIIKEFFSDSSSVNK